VERFFLTLAPVLTLSLCILGPGETRDVLQYRVSIRVPPVPATFPACSGGGSIAVLFFIAISFANLESDSKSTVKKVSSCAVDAVEL